MAEEKEKRKVWERRSAQRIKRVLADTTPKHLGQLTKQARALAGDDGEAGGYCESSVDSIRRKLGHLHKRHTLLREKLTDPSPSQKSLVSRLQLHEKNSDKGWTLLVHSASSEEFKHVGSLVAFEPQRGAHYGHRGGSHGSASQPGGQAEAGAGEEDAGSDGNAQHVVPQRPHVVHPDPPERLP